MQDFQDFVLVNGHDCSVIFEAEQVHFKIHQFQNKEVTATPKLQTL